MKSLLLVLLLAWTSVSFAGCCRTSCCKVVRPACNACAVIKAPTCCAPRLYSRCANSCNRCYTVRTRVYYAPAPRCGSVCGW
jgi:hypothetical protein